ncbi:hypothetical protein GCM10010123_45040 [Pilimelia anulata]|uniref:eCIS core domain-containing protein n=1 Tax=Pilimelia anulata TaxID=53371 RepID=A0A8J3BBH3_9ACTN|nr:hypothetical protein GCM10010123_45040 [Pilimelia anulata]
MTPAGAVALQRVAGNRAVHEAVGGAAAVHEVLRRPGRPLPVPVRAEMEGRLGADFADVRVHTDGAAHESAVGVAALAYTSGSHIVFRRGAFAPGTAAGRHTLAHELAHVVQQRHGPVGGTPTGDGLLVSEPHDPAERAADAAAHAALAAPPPGAPTADAVSASADAGAASTPSTEPAHPAAGVEGGPAAGEPAARSAHSPGSAAAGGGTVVARVPSPAEFRRATSVFGGRDQALTLVDTALTTLDGTHRDQIVPRRDALRALVQQCGNTHVGKAGGRRATAVARLRAEAAEELTIFTALADAEAAAGVPKFLAIAAAGEAALALADPDPALHAWVVNRQLGAALQQHFQTLTAAEAEQVGAHHVGQLAALAADPAVPAVTRAILADLVGHAGDIRFANRVRSGTRRTEPRGPGDPKYTIGMQTDYYDGETGRLGFVAHEMTHVAAGEAYDNTAVLLLFAGSLSDDRVAALAAARRQTMAQLRALLAAHADAFTPMQVSDLRGKMAYGESAGRLTYYADGFHRAGRIDRATHDRIRHWETLAGGSGGLLVEYDTVINQMLVWLHRWGIPPAHPLYARLLQEGQRELTARTAARAAAAPAPAAATTSTAGTAPAPAPTGGGVTE